MTHTLKILTVLAIILGIGFSTLEVSAADQCGKVCTTECCPVKGDCCDTQKGCCDKSECCKTGDKCCKTSGRCNTSGSCRNKGCCDDGPAKTGFVAMLMSLFSR